MVDPESRVVEETRQGVVVAWGALERLVGELKEMKPSGRPEVLVSEGHRVLLVHDFLDGAFCDKLRAIMDAEPQMNHCGYHRAYRDCDRIMVDSTAIAGALWTRALPFVEDEFPTVTVSPSDLTLGARAFMQGTYVPMFLNPRFRFCRYDDAGHFSPHCDGVIRMTTTKEEVDRHAAVRAAVLAASKPEEGAAGAAPPAEAASDAAGEAKEDMEGGEEKEDALEEVMSQLTFMLYLNGSTGSGCAPGDDTFEGGSTDILKDSFDVRHDEMDKMHAAEESVTHRVWPTKGLLIVFRQAVVPHSGGRVAGGKKYIWRTDVLCRKVAESVDYKLTPERVEARRLADEALECADRKEFDRAEELYRAAEKLDPDVLK